MGVRRAVELALDAPGSHPEPIYTYGPLIHNPQVLDLFAEKGIRILQEIPPSGHGTVLIRAHGVPPSDKARLKDAGFNVVDATCPRVIRVQTIIRVHARKGYATIIIGDRDHPEVVGLVGYAGSEGHVVSNMDELMALPCFERAIVVAQTTQNTRFYQAVKTWVAEHQPHYKTFDTICDSTEKRQAEVKRLADRVDAIVVVGGQQSGNTRRLVEIAADTGKPAYHVETEEDLDARVLASFDGVGITAGASTPNWIIKRVYRAIERLPTQKSTALLTALFRLAQNLLLTNVYVAFGAACPALGCIRLLGMHPKLASVAAAMLYVLSMHLLNHLTGTAEDEFNDPDRARFYQHHRLPLTVMALSAGGLGLFCAATMGTVAFVILLIMSLMGLSYNLYLVPAVLKWRFRRIKDIPGSKTVLIAIAWGVVAVLLPGIAEKGHLTITIGLVFIWAVAMVFSRTAFFDLLDVQGDRIVGKETLPLLLGKSRTFVLLSIILIASMLLIAAAAAIGMVSRLGFLLTLCPLAMLLIVADYTRGRMLPGMRLEFMVESLFVAVGGMAILSMMF